MASIQSENVLKFKDRAALQKAMQIVRPVKDINYEQSVKKVASFLKKAPKVKINNHRSVVKQVNINDWKLDTYPLLSSISDLTGFNSQEPKIDDFLLHRAYDQDTELRTQTTLMFGNQEFIGLYTTSVRTFQLEVSDLTSLRDEKLVTATEVDEMDQADMIELPVVDLRYFAIDRRFQRLGLGTVLMTNFLKNVAEAYIDHGLGFSGIFLFALPDAVPFYQNFGFRVLHGIDYENGPDLKQYPMFLNSRFLIDLYTNL